MARSKDDHVRIEYLSLAEIARWPRNPKRHDLVGIRRSIERFGFTLPIVLDETSERIVAGHGRLEVLETMRGEGAEPPRRIKVRGRGAKQQWLAPVLRGLSFADEREAEAYLLADNRLVEKGGWDTDLVAEILRDQGEGVDLRSIGWDEAELQALLTSEPQAPEPARPSEPPPLRPPRPFAGLSAVRIHAGDSMEVLLTLPGRSFDAMVTDPPAAISFMGKEWDDDKGGREQWIAWLAGIFREAARTLKPGAHALVWALPRTSHWTASALETAGFEVRDVITHHYGQGFPKSVDVAKAVDQQLGAERKKVRVPAGAVRNQKAPGGGKNGAAGATRPYIDAAQKAGFHETAGPTPATPEAERWRGYGTALKPATEHWILARLPLAGTIAENVLRYGTGALDVDGCRIPMSQGDADKIREMGGWGKVGYRAPGIVVNNAPDGKVEDAAPHPGGRWPANLVLTHAPGCGVRDEGEGVWRCAIGCPVAELDRQSGDLPSGHYPGWRGGLGYGSSDALARPRSSSDAGAAPETPDVPGH